MDNNRRFPLILSSFWLKIIALLTMTIDHVGFFMGNGPVALTFRYIGRLALPLFCFMIAEGAFHTKSFKKYALRLGIMASAISIVIIGDDILNISQGMLRAQGNIFIDLLLGALAIFFLRQKKWYLKLLALLPILFSVYAFIGSSLEWCGCHGHILWCPFFLRGQYHWFAVLLIVLFYFARSLAQLFVRYHSGLTGIDVNNYQDSNIERHALNIFSVLMIAVISVLYYFCGQLMPPQYVSWMVDVQLFAMVSGVFLLLYNGKRGYNKTWFQYGSYLYYPVHMIIIYLIYMLLVI